MFAGLDVLWLAMDYFDESELDAPLGAPLQDRYAVVVMTPTAFALPAVRLLLICQDPLRMPTG